MTTVAVAKHVARKPLAVANSANAQAAGEEQPAAGAFPPRPTEPWWPSTAQTLEETLARLTSPPFVPEVAATRAWRRRGVTKLLGWLPRFRGHLAARWLASGVEDHPGTSWVQLPTGWLREQGGSAAYDSTDLASGVLMLSAATSSGPAWRGCSPAPTVTWRRRWRRSGTRRVRPAAHAGRGRAGQSRPDARIAATRIATLLACKGGSIADITVGDCVELVDMQRRVHARGGQKKVDFYLRLRALGVFPEDAPATIRAFGLAGGPIEHQGTGGSLPARVRAGP